MKKILLLSFAIMTGIVCGHAQTQESEPAPTTPEKTKERELKYQDMPDDYFGYYNWAERLFTYNKKILKDFAFDHQYAQGVHLLFSILENKDEVAVEKAAEEMIEHDGFVIKRDPETFLFVVSALDATAKKELNIKTKTYCVDHPAGCPYQ